MNMKGIEKVRVMGEAEDADQLRAVLAAGAFAGFAWDIRIGLIKDGDGWREGFAWRTPLLTPDQLTTFLAAADAKIARVGRSQTTPTHGNVIAVLA